MRSNNRKATNEKKNNSTTKINNIMENRDVLE